MSFLKIYKNYNLKSMARGLTVISPILPASLLTTFSSKMHTFSKNLKNKSAK